MGDKFIVAELSKNWVGRQPYDPSKPLLAQMFEECINNNDARGYKLNTFSLHRLVCGDDEMNETIIAVFERKD